MCTFGVLWLSCETPAAPKPSHTHITHNTSHITRHITHTADTHRTRTKSTIWANWPKSNWSKSSKKKVDTQNWPKSNWPRPSVGPPKISRFFSLSAAKFVLFFLVWGCSRGILVPKPPGFHTTTREPKRGHLRVPDFKNTTKIQREYTQRGKKRTNFALGEGKKSEFLGGPGEGRSREGRSKPNLETNTHT